MILMKKTLEEIMEETLVELEGMGIKERDAGGIARLLLTVINTKLSEFYDALDLNLAQAFVSTANEQFLERIGVLLDCDRIPGEDIENYRYRLTKQIQVVASANKIAVRLAVLSVPGVQDVKLRPYTHGSGSYSVYVVSDNPITPDELLEQVQVKISENQSYGVNGRVYRPTPIPVELKARLLFEKGVTDLDKQLAISKAQEAVKEYVNSRNVGEPLVLNEIKKAINGVHEQIHEIMIFHFRINEKPALIVDQECAWNERFIESDKPNAIQIM